MGGLFFGDWRNPHDHVKKWGIIQYMIGLWLLWAIPIHAQPHTIAIGIFTHRIFSWGNCLQNWDLAKHGFNSETNGKPKWSYCWSQPLQQHAHTHTHCISVVCIPIISLVSPHYVKLLISPWYIPMITHRNKNNHLIFASFQKSRDPVLIYYFCLGFSMN